MSSRSSSYASIQQRYMSLQGQGSLKILRPYSRFIVREKRVDTKHRREETPIQGVEIESKKQNTSDVSPNKQYLFSYPSRSPFSKRIKKDWSNLPCSFSHVGSYRKPLLGMLPVKTFSGRDRRWGRGRGVVFACQAD